MLYTVAIEWVDVPCGNNKTFHTVETKIKVIYKQGVRECIQ